MKHLNDDELCFVCRRRAMGLGVGSIGRVGWTCTDCTPDLANEALHMSDREFDIYEKRALERAGEKAGEYLDTLGVTDLAKLHSEEWQTFLEIVVRSFGEAIRTQIGSHKAPF